MTTYYCTATATGGGDGTEASPWSASEVNILAVGFFVGGDVLKLSGDFVEQISFAQQGDAIDFFTVEAHGSCTVTPETLAPSEACISFTNCGKTRVRGITVNAALQDTSYGFAWVWVATAASNAEAFDCTARNCGATGFTYGFLSTSAASGVPFLVARCSAIVCGDNGFDTFGVTNGPVFLNNYGKDIGINSGDKGNPFGGDFISLHESTSNAVIVGNVVDGCVNAVHNISLLANGGVIHGNFFTGCTGTGIICEDWEVTPVDQDWWITCNVICASGQAASWDAACISIGHQTQRTSEPNAAVGGLQSVYIRNNLLWNQSTANYALMISVSNQAGNSSNTLDVRNNIFARVNAGGLNFHLVTRGVNPTITFDRNRYEADGATLFRRTVSGVGTNYTLATWQALGYDTNSTTGAIGLTGTPTANPLNARLTAASACVGAGANVTDTANGNVWGYDRRDYRNRIIRGSTRDIGPFQRTGFLHQQSGSVSHLLEA